MTTPISTAKSALKRLSWKRALIIYSVAISTLAFILVIALYNSGQAEQRRADELAARQKTRDTLLALFDRPIINAGGDKILFPEMKLALPATMVSRTILYQYTGPTYTAKGTAPEGATFASRTAINQSANPGGSDTCNILAAITVGQPKADKGGLTYAGTTSLPGGKVLYIYQNKANCSKVWGGLDSDTVVLLLKQAQTY